MNKELFEKVYEDVLAFGVQGALKGEVEKANLQYIGDDPLSEIQGFDEWYVFNYKPEGQEKTIYDLAVTNGIDAEGLLTNTFRSFFEVSVQRESTYLKDIFSGKDYLLVGETMTQGNIVSMRLGYDVELKGYVQLCEAYNFEPLYKEVIKKYMMTQYNEFVKLNGPVPVESFVKDALQLIFKMHNIVNTLYDESDIEEELLLHEASYAFKCTVDALVDKLSEMPYDIYIDEEESDILRIISDEIIIAELEIIAPKMNVLCNTEKHLKQMMHAIETLGFDELVFLNQEILTIDGVLA